MLAIMLRTSARPPFVDIVMVGPVEKVMVVKATDTLDPFVVYPLWFRLRIVSL